MTDELNISGLPAVTPTPASSVEHRTPATTSSSRSELSIAVELLSRGGAVVHRDGRSVFGDVHFIGGVGEAGESGRGASFLGTRGKRPTAAR
jgi:hypothetical protein